jgi:hypothetical protein
MTDAEKIELANFFDFEAALNRAIRRGHPESLRERCYSCSGRCKKCIAVDRVLVRTYFGAENPPAWGSSWYPGNHEQEIEAELASICGTGESCDQCRVLWKPPSCGCRNGACNLPAAVSLQTN